MNRVKTNLKSTATYGYLDGDYIFSAALLLVMVNAAFPGNEGITRSMETALNLLRSMADKGNTYLASRHSLLLELRSAIEPRPATGDAEPFGPDLSVSGTPKSDLPASSGIEEPMPNPPNPMNMEDWLEFPSLEGMSFEIDINDDPALWEGALNQIDIDMDNDWIENTLRR